MPYIDQVSGNTINKPNIDSDYNLAVNFPMTGLYAGFTTVGVEIDSGSVTGQRVFRALDASWDSRLRVGLDTPIFNDKFVDGLPQNTSLYFSSGNTMTVASSGGFLILNDNLTTTSNTDIRYQTWRSFPVLTSFGTKFNCYGQLSQLPVVGNVTEWGLGIAFGRTEPTDGVFFRYSGSNLYAVANNNSTGNVVSIAGPSLLIGSGQTRKFEINLQAEHATFSIDNAIVANIDHFAGSGVGSESITASARFPLLLRTYNTDATAAAQQFKVSAISIFQQDANANKSWASQEAGMGSIASQGQNGMTMGSTARYSNNTALASGIGSNTVANLGTGLGGSFIWSGTIASASTDYIISSYQNPPMSSTMPGKTLYINGVSVSATNMSGNSAAGQVTSLMTVCYGHTSESLATTESETTKAPRFIPIGVLSIPASSALGFSSRTITFPFASPIVVNSSEHFAIAAKFLAGNGLEHITQYNIGVDGYWE